MQCVKGHTANKEDGLEVTKVLTQPRIYSLVEKFLLPFFFFGVKKSDGIIEFLCNLGTFHLTFCFHVTESVRMDVDKTF